MKKRLLFLSNLYPNLAYPNQATFNFQQVQALSEWFDVSVMSPIPWVDLVAVKSVRNDSREDTVSTFPIYWYTPGILRSLYGQMMFSSVAATAEKMHRNRPFDLVFGAWLYPDGWAAGRLAKRWNIPFYQKVHGTDVNRLAARGPLTKASLSGIGECHGVICVSQALKTKLVDLGVPEDKCHVVYNGVDSSIFFPMPKIEAREQLGISEKGKIILFVGNLLATKGLGELAAAFGRIARSRSDVRLVVVGVGAWKEQFRGRLRREGVIGKVELPGSINHRDIGKYMNAADILCLPSYMEGVPNVILEALACNTLVVATAVGGVPELARDENRIFLAQPKNSDSIYSELIRALESDPTRHRLKSIMSWRENAARVASVLMNRSVDL
jgi:glycosyltransferase involved in cell wall biosynthesis